MDFLFSFYCAYTPEVSSMKHRISRMVAHFRVDPEGKLWFLWCSSLRLYRDPSPDADAAKEANPRAINLDPDFKLKPQSTFLVQPKKGMPLLRSNLFACPSCGAACETKLRCEVSFKTCILLHKRKMMKEYGLGVSAPPGADFAVRVHDPKSVSSEPSYSV